MKIGFTGTGQGMTASQTASVYYLLKELNATELHHGDCVGADATAHNVAWRMGLRTVQHPPSNPRARAFTQCSETRPEKPYLDRNHDIVDETELLIACPNTKEEVLRSGTWATIRYARKVGKPVTIIYP